MIKLSHIKKSYGTTTPLKDVNAEIRKGDVIAVIGPSGCGKSTLLRLINLLEKPTSGQILVDGIDVTAPGYKETEIRKKIGMVFQSFNLFGHLTVIENIMVPAMDILGISKQEAYDRAMELLRSVGMEGRAMRYPKVLSGGQKQRVAIARTLAMEPEIILFDEPTSALDPTMVGEVESVIRNLAKEGTTMMIVTHEMRFAKEISNRVFYMDEGEIYEEGTPKEIFEEPRRPNTRRFIHQLKTFETVIDSPEYDFIGTITGIDRYGQKLLLDRGQILNMQAVFEELCQQILLRNDPECRIRFAIERSERDNVTKVIARYSGSPFNPENTGNDFSLAILRSKTGEIEYTQTDDEEYPNQVIMRLA